MRETKHERIVYDSTFISSSKQAKLICGLVLMTVITFAEEQEE